MSLFEIEKTKSPKMKPDFSDLGFGKYFSDHMFLIEYIEGEGWGKGRIRATENLSLDPAASVLHYGQSLFEGMKAFKTKSGKTNLFRPDYNWQRMKNGADRLCMQMPDKEIFVEAIKALVKIDQDWIPNKDLGSLYIRPTLIATEGFLGVRPSKKYLFFILLSPVGSYYSSKTDPVKIWVEKTYLRAAPGGLGDIKASANYAGSLKAALEAKKKDFAQVLWLDMEKKNIEEVGTMNVFFIFEDEIVTPALNGSILPGKTRDCVLQILKDLGHNVNERALSIDEVLQKHKDGQLKEVFGTGTAAVISSVGLLASNDWEISINDNQTGKITNEVQKIITDLQFSENPEDDRYSWVCAL